MHGTASLPAGAQPCPGDPALPRGLLTTAVRTMRIASDRRLTSRGLGLPCPQGHGLVGKLAGSRDGGLPSLAGSWQEPFSAPRPPVFPATAPPRPRGLLLRS